MKYFLLDVIAIFLFAVFARMAHKAEPFTFINILDTWWPFLIGVILGWVLLRFITSPPASFAAGSIVWVCSVVCGLGIWAGNNGRVPHISFIIVATVMSGLLLLGWRGAARVIRKA